MVMTSLQELLTDQLKDIYSAEYQLLKALPEMSRKARADGLKQTIDNHLVETQRQIARLDQAATALGVSFAGKKCKAMESLIAEYSEWLEGAGPGAVIDAAIIAAARKIEHYEISAYGSARAIAEQLGLGQVAALLNVNLEEETSADDTLTKLSVSSVLPAAHDAGSAE